MSCPSGVKQSTSWPPALNNTKYTLVSFIKCYKSDRGLSSSSYQKCDFSGFCFNHLCLKYIQLFYQAGLSPHSSTCSMGCGLADLDPAGRWTPGREVMYPVLIHMAGLANFTWKEPVSRYFGFFRP